jgi:signal peptidase I
MSLPANQPEVAHSQLAVEPERIPLAKPAVAAAESHTLLHAMQSLLYIIVVAIFIITFIFQPFRIPSESMEPTLLVGDFLLVAKQQVPFPKDALPFPATPIKRGDVIVFHYPLDPSIHLVKRVIGLPGDHLRLRDGRVFIDGRALDEPYAVYRPGPADNYRDNFPRLANPDPDVSSNWWIQMKSLVNRGELTVPPRSFFVLGDNRNDSEDSRYWGFVPASAIVGKPLLVYFSLNQAGKDQDADDADDGSGSETPTTPHVSALPRSQPKRPATFSGILNFARWDRVLRVIR